jgi:hypothetical protein
MTKLWTQNIMELFNKKHLLEIMPQKHYDKNRKLNAVFRFSIYYSLIVYFLCKKETVFYFPLVIGVLTIILGNLKITDTKEPYSNIISSSLIDDINLQDRDNCKNPKLNNPFMNLNWTHINDKNPKQACYSYDNDNVKSEIDNYFDEGLIKGFDDIYNNTNSQNRFYTMPNTMPSNKQKEFGEWLYGTPDTCKQGNGLQCANNLYTRINMSSTDNNPHGIPPAYSSSYTSNTQT